MRVTNESGLDDWCDELKAALVKSNSIAVAIISHQGELLFSNSLFDSLVHGDVKHQFINPTFDQLAAREPLDNKVFEGFLTIGNLHAVNTSIWAQVYSKDNGLLLVGGIDAEALNTQNLAVHRLNDLINTLQNDLVKEKNELKLALSNLNAANEELQTLNSNKDRFIAIMAHDLKNPFNSLLGFLSLLKNNVRTYSVDKIEHQVNIIHSSANKVYRLLEDLLMWVRAESGKLPFDPKSTNLAALFDEVIDLLAPLATIKSIRIEMLVSSDLCVLIDVNMIKTVLQNLLTNAIKFTNENGVIVIYSNECNGLATVVVSDNGVGIDDESLSNLFNMAFIRSTSGTNKESGTGLGLLLCKEFVEKHNGQIWAESEVGKGSKFKFTLPICS